MTLALVGGESRFADITNNFILTADKKNVFKLPAGSHETSARK
jgi:hypothetical protein